MWTSRAYCFVKVISLPATMPKRQTLDSEYWPVSCVPVPFKVPETVTGQLFPVEARVTDIAEPSAVTTPFTVPLTLGWPFGKVMVQVPVNWDADASGTK